MNAAETKHVVGCDRDSSIGGKEEEGQRSRMLNDDTARRSLLVSRWACFVSNEKGAYFFASDRWCLVKLVLYWGRAHGNEVAVSLSFKGLVTRSQGKWWSDKRREIAILWSSSNRTFKCWHESGEVLCSFDNHHNFIPTVSQWQIWYHRYFSSAITFLLLSIMS